jgi:uncharacterized membrane protein HdeD (DUF308 family)
MGNIIAGVVLIVIGLVMGGSVFLGDFSITSIIFDGLGVFFIIRGIVQVMRSRQAPSA